MQHTHAVSSGADYARYLERDLVEEAYWIGRGAELLGIEGRPVTVRDFDLLQRGVNPDTGEVLRPRVSHDCYAANGERVSRGRGLYEAVVMPPKSVSIAALHDERILAAHRDAVLHLTKAMEEVAWTRVRRNGAEQNRETKAIIAAPWLHATSRAGDPQIHTHLTAMNLTYDQVENRWKALQAIGIFQRRYEYTEQYREIMAQSMQHLGYSIERVGRTPNAFEIAGISPELRDKFSQRSKERDAAVEGFKEWHGREPTNRELAILVRNHREEKPAIVQEQIREQQLARLTPSERIQLVAVRDRAMEHSLEPGEHLKPYLQADKYFEPGLRQESWNYGQKNQGRKMGF